jgi:ATP-binding cassette subfamily F protein 3
LRHLEEQMEDLSARRSALEQVLADPALYEAEAKPRLLAILGEKRRLDAAIEETEAAWVEAGERLERESPRPREA